MCGTDLRFIQQLLRDAGYELRRQARERLGIPMHRRTLWDGDHIIPVSRGGGGCGLDNYRTLCFWCHKGETKALVHELATERRDQARPLLSGLSDPIHVTQ